MGLPLSPPSSSARHSLICSATIYILPYSHLPGSLPTTTAISPFTTTASHCLPSIYSAGTLGKKNMPPVLLMLPHSIGVGRPVLALQHHGRVAHSCRL